MKTLISVLIIFAFIQTSVIPIDLVLLILISRAYIKSDPANYYLAFGLGLLVGHLNLTALGLLSLFYITSTAATEALSKLRLAGNPLAIVPLVFVLSLANQSLFSRRIDLAETIFSSVLALPILYAVRLWEERFIVQKDIKLKI